MRLEGWRITPPDAMQRVNRRVESLLRLSELLPVQRPDFENFASIASNTALMRRTAGSL